MRKRRTSKATEELELAGPEAVIRRTDLAEAIAAGTAVVPGLPPVLEYRPYSSTEPWRVQLFELFQAEFALPLPYEKSMGMFHEIAEPQIRGWLIAKLIYGITPMIIPENTDPKDMEAAPREQVCAKLGIEKEQLQAELDALRALYQATLAASPKNENEDEGRKTEAGGQNTLDFDETKFKDFGFSENIFDVNRKDPTTKEDKPRSADERNIERAWFIKRVCEWGKMLSEPMVSAIVRQALMNELYMRRLETEISMVMPGTDLFSRLQKVKKEIEDTYQGQLEEIKLNFPEMNVAGKVTLRGAISDLKDAYLEYKKDGTTRLIDRMRTGFEIEIECRQSLQKPEPQYRMGLNIYWIEAMRGLYDPEWRSKLSPRTLKKMDAAGRAAIEAARAESGEPMVDLERGVSPDEGSQFPDLITK